MQKYVSLVWKTHIRTSQDAVVGTVDDRSQQHVGGLSDVRIEFHENRAAGICDIDV
jgi:hypothetical protein